jgi:ATP-dependent Lon protease
MVIWKHYSETTLMLGATMSIAEQKQPNSNDTLSETQESQPQEKKKPIRKKIKPTFPHVFFDPRDVLKCIESITDADYHKEVDKWIKNDSYERELKELFKPNIESLYSEFPNFKEVVEFYDGQVKLSELACKWFSARPVLLLGDAGIGKTHFTQKLAEELDLSYKIINCATVSAGWVISGLSSSWKGAKVGEIARFMRDSKYSNPIIMLDEIDKLSSVKDGDSYGCLYSLLEHKTSKKFVDEFLDFPIDLSNVNWIATANDVSTIPEPILSRFKIIHVGNPTKEHMKIIVKNMFNNIKEDLNLNLAINSIESDAVELIANSCTTPREANVMLLESFGKAARMHLEVGPVNIKAEHCVVTTKTKRKLGF